MNRKQNTPNESEVVLVGTRVPPVVKHQFFTVAAKHNRSVAGQLRHMIEEQIEADLDESEKEAA